MSALRKANADLAYYLTITPQSTTAVVIDAIADAFGGLSGGTSEQQLVFDAVTDAIGLLGLGGTNGDAVPAGYLNYLVFDDNMNYLKGGFTSVSSVASFNLELISLPNIDIDDNGYIYIYISNESNSLNYVYFDDLKVTHIPSPIIQTDDYYPFGLTMNSYQRTGSKANGFLYNGKEKQDELDLGLYDYMSRYYDPAIGRFINVDPAADLMRRYSPYSYAFDNPIRFTDPDGMVPDEINKRVSLFDKQAALGAKFGGEDDGGGGEGTDPKKEKISPYTAKSIGNPLTAFKELGEAILSVIKEMLQPIDDAVEKPNKETIEVDELAVDDPPDATPLLNGNLNREVSKNTLVLHSKKYSIINSTVVIGKNNNHEPDTLTIDIMSNGGFTNIRVASQAVRNKVKAEGTKLPRTLLRDDRIIIR